MNTKLEFRPTVRLLNMAASRLFFFFSTACIQQPRCAALYMQLHNVTYSFVALLISLDELLS